MEDVTVKIEKERMAEFFALYSKFLADAPTANATEDEDGGADTLKPWGLGDEPLARVVWLQMSDKAKDLFKILVTAPGDVPSDELARALGPNAGADTVAGTFAWPARFALAVGRTPPTRGGTTSAGTVYWLEPEAKAVFGKVAAEDE